MAIIYISTDEQVTYDRTADLLEECHAIWCPPHSLRPWNGTPQSEHEITVLAHRGANYTLLGAGITRPNPRLIFDTHLLWTEADIQGIRQRAQELGYGGPENMSFLLLDDVLIARLGISGDIGDSLDALNPGLNVVPEQLVQRLIEIIKAPTRPPIIKQGGLSMDYEDDILKCKNSDEIHMLLSTKLSFANGNALIEQDIAKNFTATVKDLMGKGRIIILSGRIDFLRFQGVELPFFMGGTNLSIK